MSKTFDFDCAAVAQSIVRSFLEAEKRIEPFPVLILRDVLPEKEIDRLLATREHRIFIPWDDRFYCKLDIADPIVRGFNTQQVQDVVEQTVGIKGQFEPRINHDPVGISLETHPDVEIKSGTIQIYLEGDEEGGTVVRSRNRKRVYKVPFERNCGYAFKRTETSYHSLDTVKTDRWSLLVPVFVT